MMRDHWFDRPTKITCHEVDESGNIIHKVLIDEGIRVPKNIIVKQQDPKIKNPKWNKKKQGWEEDAK